MSETKPGRAASFCSRLRDRFRSDFCLLRCFSRSADLVRDRARREKERRRCCDGLLRRRFPLRERDRERRRPRDRDLLRERRLLRRERERLLMGL